MKVFISWSGQQSLATAEALHTWLPDTIQQIKPWMSKKDIRAGARWTPQINAQLSQTKFGIICLTQENQHAPWVLFEAGALAKAIDDARVVPFLIDMEPSDVEGPLSQFQAQRRSKEGTLELVRSMNQALGEGALSEESLMRVFNRGWPELAEAFASIPKPTSPTQNTRSDKAILREILERVRDISRDTSNLPTRSELSKLGISPAKAAFDKQRYEELREEIEFDMAMEAQEAELDPGLEMEEEARRDAELEASIDMEEAQREVEIEASIAMEEAQRESELDAQEAERDY